MASRHIEECLAGRAVYGDDFSPDQVRTWFAEEREAYADLGSADAGAYAYGYHALNRRHGFRWLPGGIRFRHALGIGSAYGDEFRPIASRISRITIVEASHSLRRASVAGVPVSYVDPDASGLLPFGDASFDLALCLGTLHHIPNVSTVLGEITRCVEPNGYVLVREPTISMGDWRVPRAGLTKNERGIPLELLRRMIRNLDLEVVQQTRCMFSLTGRLARALRVAPYNSDAVVRLDRVLASMFERNETYHARSQLERLRPTSVYLVLQKVAR